VKRFDPGQLRRVGFRILGKRNEALVLALERFQQNVFDVLESIRLGTSWQEIRGEWRGGLSASDLTSQEVPDGSGFFLPCFDHTQDDAASFVFPLGRQWDGSPVIPFIEVAPLAAGAGVVVFAISYCWLASGRNVTAFSDQATVALSVAVGNEGEKMRVPMGTAVPPTGLPRDTASLLVSVSRLGAGAADTYSTSKAWGSSLCNVALLGVGVSARLGIWGGLHAEC